VVFLDHLVGVGGSRVRLHESCGVKGQTATRIYGAIVSGQTEQSSEGLNGQCHDRDWKAKVNRMTHYVWGLTFGVAI
jgi:hypothetical protein